MYIFLNIFFSGTTVYIDKPSASDGTCNFVTNLKRNFDAFETCCWTLIVIFIALCVLTCIPPFWFVRSPPIFVLQVKQAKHFNHYVRRPSVRLSRYAFTCTTFVSLNSSFIYRIFDFLIWTVWETKLLCFSCTYLAALLLMISQHHEIKQHWRWLCLQYGLYILV